MILIALCGAPGSGKTEVQKYLQTTYWTEPADDGWPIRDFAVRHFGLTPWHVNTQEGKASNVTLPGGNIMPVRLLLGSIGNMIESIAGPDAIPAMAVDRVAKDAHARNNAPGYCGGPEFSYCFGSVRREQGWYYRRRGAMVVEIVRPGRKCVNEFDQYAKSCIDFVIHNDGSMAALRERVEFTLGPLLRGRATP